MNNEQKKRFLVEVLNLKHNIEKLSDFLCSDGAEKLEDKSYMLLEMQQRAMMTYMDVLVLRGEYEGLSDELSDIFSEGL